MWPCRQRSAPLPRPQPRQHTHRCSPCLPQLGGAPRAWQTIRHASQPAAASARQAAAAGPACSQSISQPEKAVHRGRSLSSVHAMQGVARRMCAAWYGVQGGGGQQNGNNTRRAGGQQGTTCVPCRKRVLAGCASSQATSHNAKACQHVGQPPSPAAHLRLRRSIRKKRRQRRKACRQAPREGWHPAGGPC